VKKARGPKNSWPRALQNRPFQPVLQQRCQCRHCCQEGRDSVAFQAQSATLRNSHMTQQHTQRPQTDA